MTIATIKALERCGVQVKISDVSSALNLPRPGVTRTVREMEDRGYLRKTASDADGRITYLSITDAGKALSQTYNENFFSRLAPLLAGLSFVSTGSQGLNLVTFVVTQLAMGVTVLIARYLGERRPERSGAVLGGARRGVHDPRGCDVRAAGGLRPAHRGFDAGAGGSRRADGKLCAHLRRRYIVHRCL